MALISEFDHCMSFFEKVVTNDRVFEVAYIEMKIEIVILILNLMVQLKLYYHQRLLYFNHVLSCANFKI